MFVGVMMPTIGVVLFTPVSSTPESNSTVTDVTPRANVAAVILPTMKPAPP